MPVGACVTGAMVGRDEADHKGNQAVLEAMLRRQVCCWDVYITNNYYHLHATTSNNSPSRVHYAFNLIEVYQVLLKILAKSKAWRVQTLV